LKKSLDTFASKVAAINDKYADSSVGNVTGSNAVNVFLGIGLAWLAAAIYHTAKGTKFIVNPGSLAFSVTLFCSFALVAIALMMVRRMKFCGGELGGPPKSRLFTASLFFGLWVLYLVLSSLESYCVIKGF
jgi:solute carrier family 8 (sodium/calcium exchanger)